MIRKNSIYKFQVSTGVLAIYSSQIRRDYYTTAIVIVLKGKPATTILVINTFQEFPTPATVAQGLKDRNQISKQPTKQKTTSGTLLALEFSTSQPSLSQSHWLFSISLTCHAPFYHRDFVYTSQPSLHSCLSFRSQVKTSLGFLIKQISYSSVVHCIFFSFLALVTDEPSFWFRGTGVFYVKKNSNFTVIGVTLPKQWDVSHN